MTSKTSIIPTNFNNKLDCPHFVHIDKAPPGLLRAANTVFELRTADNSHPPVKVKISDLIRVKLREVRSYLSWQSHGMDGYTFKSWALSHYKDLSAESELAVYFFERI